MELEVWVGLIEVRQLPIQQPSIVLSGVAAFTWITCWATDESSYLERVASVMGEYGLFVAGSEHVRTFRSWREDRVVGVALLEQVQRTMENVNFVIYGSFHTYGYDN